MLLRRRTGETFFFGRPVQVRRDVARAEIERILSEEGAERELRTVLARDIPSQTADEMGPAQIADVLADGVAAGRYVIMGFRPRPPWSPIDNPAQFPEGDEVKPSDEKEEEEGWLEIELVDKDTPPKPVAGAKYVVELKDGTKVEGTLGDDGKARVEGVKKGSMSKVSFPEIDAPEWK
jgi:hypothetical protein